MRATGCFVQSLAALGGGVPDILVSRGRVMVLMEIKDGSKPPSKRRLTPDQEAWRAAWRGPPVEVVLSVDDALRAMDRAINKAT